MMTVVLICLTVNMQFVMYLNTWNAVTKKVLTKNVQNTNNKSLNQALRSVLMSKLKLLKHSAKTAQITIGYTHGNVISLSNAGMR